MANLNSFLVAHDLHLELEQALARQHTAGGDLVTCLLEVASISERKMLALLAEAYGRAAALPGELPAPATAARRLVPRATAQRYALCPLEIRGDVLIAFVHEPLPAAIEDDLVFALGVQIEQRIALAARVHQALARAYGIPLAPRMKEIIGKLDGPIAEPIQSAGIAQLPLDPYPTPVAAMAAMPQAGAPTELERTPESEGLSHSTAHLAPAVEARPGATARSSEASTLVGISPARRGPVEPQGSPWKRDPTLVGVAPARRIVEGTPSGAPRQNARSIRPAQHAMPPPNPGAPSSEAEERADWRTAPEVPRAAPSHTPTVPYLPQLASSSSNSPPRAPLVEFVMEASSTTAAEIEERRRRRAKLPAGTSVLREWALRALGLSEPTGLSSERRRGPLTHTAAEKALDQVRTPDEALRVYFDFVSQYFEYTAMFRLHGDLAEGHDAWGPGATRDRVRAIGVALDLPSILSRARDTGAPVVTVPSPDGIDAVLAEDLGRPMRREVACVPVLVRGRTLIVTYGDLGSEPVHLDDIGEVISLASLLASTLERMLVRRKREISRASRAPAAMPMVASSEPESPPESLDVRGTTEPEQPLAPQDGEACSAAPPVVDASEVPGAVPASEADDDREPTSPAAGHEEADPAFIDRAWAALDPPRDSVLPPTPPRAAFDVERDAPTPFAPDAAFDRQCDVSPTPLSPASVLDADQDLALTPIAPQADTRPAPIIRSTTPVSRGAFDNYRRNSPPPAASRSEAGAPSPASTGDTTPVASPLAHLAALSATWTLDPAAVLGSTPPRAPSSFPASPVTPTTQNPAVRSYARPVADSSRVEPSFPRLSYADPSHAEAAKAEQAGSEHLSRELLENDDLTFPSIESSPASENCASPAGNLGASAAAMAAGLRPIRIPHIAREEPESDPKPWTSAPPAAVAIGKLSQTPTATGGAVAVGARQPPASMGMVFSTLPPVLIHADLVETVIAGGPMGERALGEILEIGEAAIPSIFSRFPGPLSVDRKYAATELPRPDECGPVLRILSALRRLALPFLAVRSADTSAEVRFWATYLLGDLHYHDAAIALWPRLFDEDFSVRTIALHAARSFVASKEAGAPIRAGLERIIASPDEPEERRLHAIATIGALEWTPFVPALLRILDRSRSRVSLAAAEALSALTGEDFGADPKIWNKWWKNKGRLLGLGD